MYVVVVYESTFEPQSTNEGILFSHLRTYSSVRVRDMISYVVLLRLTQIVTVRVLPEVLPYFRTKVFYFRKYDTSGSTLYFRTFVRKYFRTLYFRTKVKVVAFML